HPLEVADDRDRATLPHRERFLAPLGGKRGAGFGERWVVEGKLRCRGAGETLKLNPGIGWKARAHERVEGSANFLRVLRTHQPKRYFCHGLSRNHSFRPFAGITADHPVDLGGWPRGDLLDQHAVLFTRWHFEPDLAQEIFRREVEPLEVGLDLRRQLAH